MDLHFASPTDAIPRPESHQYVWVPSALVLELADGDDELIADLVAAFTTAPSPHRFPNSPRGWRRWKPSSISSSPPCSAI